VLFFFLLLITNFIISADKKHVTANIPAIKTGRKKKLLVIFLKKTSMTRNKKQKRALMFEHFFQNKSYFFIDRLILINSQLLQHLHHSLSLQNQIPQPVITDPILQLVTKIQLPVGNSRFKIFELYVGIFF
jgi:hypothetical protein